MRVKLTLSLLAIGATAALTARADLFDNFDSYADNAAFAAVWTPSTGTGLTLNTAESISAPNSVKNPGTTAQASRRAMDPIGANVMDFTFRFYDYATVNARDYGMVYSRAGGGAWTDGLNNLLAIGKYNTITGTRYYGRVSTATGAVYGDGASTPASTWFQLGVGTTGYPVPSIGWHTAEIRGEDSTAFAGKVKYSFYIDGMLGGTVDNLSIFSYNWVVLGSGLSTAPSGLAFDDVSVLTVPEPSVLALGLLGVLALAGRRGWHRS